MPAARKPAEVEIRSYQVGFGDCFLLTFAYSATDRRHVLIDFGTTELPRRGRPAKAAAPSEHMPKVAEDIRQVTGGKLTAVVATHRHADHISGFATDGRSGGSGKIIAALKPQVVVQPWTEDPAAARNAMGATTDLHRTPKSFVAGLRSMHAIAKLVYEMAQHPPAWMGVKLQRQLAFLGLDNIANESAVKNLIAMGAAPGSTAVFAHHGSPSGLERLLPGVRVTVLGPPDLRQTDAVRRMRSRDPDEFWHLLAGSAAVAGRGPSPRAAQAAAERARNVPPSARWFRDRLERLSGAQILEIVRTLDDQMNNTSLILLFEVGGKRLLFPGDAQIENWMYALQEAPQSKKTRALLAGVDVYKVGHHGSLNATPKNLLWANFAKRGGGEGAGLTTLLSTLPGKHGTPGSGTEVPRRPLLETLKRESTLYNTNQLKFGADPELWNLVRVPIA